MRLDRADKVTRNRFTIGSGTTSFRIGDGSTQFATGKGKTNFNSGAATTSFKIPVGRHAQAYFVMQSDDGFWYQLSIVESVPGTATLDINPIAVDAGTQAYRVLTNTSDGLKYKFQLFTEAGTVDWDVDDEPVTARLTPTIFRISGRLYELSLKTDGGITWQLNQL